MLVLETGMVGTFVAQDLILFFVFFEVVLLPMYFMIGVWGGENRLYAAIKFFLFTAVRLGVDDRQLPGAVLPRPIPQHLRHRPSCRQRRRRHRPHHAAAGSSAACSSGFAIKVPMFPFHTWLPDAHTEAPTVGSVILAAVLLKLGTYGFMRIAIPILPEAAEDWAPWIGLLAVIGIIYGALGLPGPDRHEAADRLLARSPTWASRCSASPPSPTSGSTPR